MRTGLYPIPLWALGYLVNGDQSGLEFGEKEMIDEWLKKRGIIQVLMPHDTENYHYFSDYPPFGLPCEVTDCDCVYDWRDNTEEDEDNH